MREQERGSSNAKPLDPARGAGVDLSAASAAPTASAVMVLQQMAGNRATAQLLARTRAAEAGDRRQLTRYLQRVRIDEKDVKKIRMPSQFKDFYELGDGRILSVRTSRTKEADDMTKQEYEALTTIKAEGVAVPDPELIDFRPTGTETTYKSIAMRRVEGSVIDFNKIENDKLILRIVVGTLRGDEVDTTEAGLARSLGQPVPELKKEKEVPAVGKVLKGLDAIMKSKEKIAINDLQLIIDKAGNVTVFDAQWAGSWEDVKPAEKVMIEQAYKRVEALGNSLFAMAKTAK